MTMVPIRIGAKFPEEEKIQSVHSPSVVADEEVVEGCRSRIDTKKIS